MDNCLTLALNAICGTVDGTEDCGAPDWKQAAIECRDIARAALRQFELEPQIQPTVIRPALVNVVSSTEIRGKWHAGLFAFSDGSKIDLPDFVRVVEKPPCPEFGYPGGYKLCLTGDEETIRGLMVRKDATKQQVEDVLAYLRVHHERRQQCGLFKSSTDQLAEDARQANNELCATASMKIADNVSREFIAGPASPGDGFERVEGRTIYFQDGPPIEVPEWIKLTHSKHFGTWFMIYGESSRDFARGHSRKYIEEGIARLRAEYETDTVVPRGVLYEMAMRAEARDCTCPPEVVNNQGCQCGGK